MPHVYLAHSTNGDSTPLTLLLFVSHPSLTLSVSALPSYVERLALWEVLNDAQQQLQTPEIQLTLNLLRARAADPLPPALSLFLSHSLTLSCLLACFLSSFFLEVNWLYLTREFSQLQGARRFLATMRQPYAALLLSACGSTNGGTNGGTNDGMSATAPSMCGFSGRSREEKVVIWQGPSRQTRA